MSSPLFDPIKVPLENGGITLVDPADSWVTQFRWFRLDVKGKHYAYRSTRPRTYLHRLLMQPNEGLTVDHINGDGLDNRRGNLRVCTQGQNQCNQQKQKRPTSSRFKGVYWWSHRSIWAAHIKHNRKRICLGYFKSEEDAARAYDAAAGRLFGEFANLNFPPENHYRQAI